MHAQSAPARGFSADPANANKSPPASANEAHGLAIFAHLSVLIGFVIPLLNIIVPVVIWQMKRGEDEFGEIVAGRNIR